MLGRTLRRLWDDDSGAIVSAEIILIIGILIFGLIPGLVALRNAGNAALASLSNIISVMLPVFSYSSLNIGGTPATVVVILPGNVTDAIVTASQVPPTPLPGNVVVSPAP